MAKKSINILDKDYTRWVKELSTRYRKSQIKAAVKVNSEMLRYYWELGRDIVTKQAESKWGCGFMKNLSRDLKAQIPSATCFSPTNILYMKNFYLMYQPYLENAPKIGEQKEDFPITPQVVEQIAHDIFSIPWGHHRFLIDRFQNYPQKALFFARQTVENGWNRSSLLNALSSDLYERKEKDKVQAQYALESSTQPISISEYELEKFYPENVEGTMPTIEELEQRLSSL